MPAQNADRSIASHGHTPVSIAALDYQPPSGNERSLGARAERLVRISTIYAIHALASICFVLAVSAVFLVVSPKVRQHALQGQAVTGSQKAAFVVMPAVFMIIFLLLGRWLRSNSN